MGPTSANMSPVRIVFVKSAAAKERLRPALSPGNLDKTMAAPVCAIIGHDLVFSRVLPNMFPVRDITGLFQDHPKAARVAAFSNAPLPVGRVLPAERAHGRDGRAGAASPRGTQG